MRFPLHAAALAALAALALPAGVRSQVAEYRFVPDLKIDISSHNIRRGGGLLTVGPSGQIVLLPEQYRSKFLAFDSTGKDLGWDLAIGRTSESEIGWVRRLGWVGDSMWVDDMGFEQLVLVDPAGKPVRSLGEPSWVRPAWGDRRRYPLFARMTWEALLPDGTVLVQPSELRNIFDTPLYDRGQRHILRVNRDGRILNTAARFRFSEGVLELRDGAQRKRQRVDYDPRTFFRVGGSSPRVAVVTQSRTDSGRFNVTVTTPTGDTVYSRHYVAVTQRIPPARKDSMLQRIQPFGKHSAQAIRDTVAKLMAVFEPPVVNLTLGVDGSVWVWLREPGRSPQEWRAMILRPNGDVVGMTTLSRAFRASEVSTDHVWAITRPSERQVYIERFRREPVRAARPARSARTSASSAP